MSHPGALLSAYLDGELTLAERRGLLGHLGECAPCRDELAVLDHARGAVRSLPLLELPPDLLVVPAPDTGRRSALRPARLAWVAAAAAVLVFSIGLARGGSDTGQIDFEGVVDQHVARVSLDPGVASIKVVSAVNAP